MSARRRYRKKSDRFVTAVRMKLDMDGFSYRKWGEIQTCKPGDWLVDNDGDVYTVDAGVFARTYRSVGPGVYVKSTPVWAEVATASGKVFTLEGASEYVAGDYIVSNDEDGSDAYCVAAAKFEEMYEPDDDKRV